MKFKYVHDCFKSLDYEIHSVFIKLKLLWSLKTTGSNSQTTPTVLTVSTIFPEVSVELLLVLLISGFPST